MSDLSVSLRDKQLLEQKQIEDSKREHERKINDLQKDYQTREERVRSSGDAAISHIRKTTDDRIEMTRADSRQRLERENESINKNYSDLRKRSQQQIANMDAQISEAEDRKERSIARTQSEETIAIRKSQEKMRDFLDRQQEVRTREENDLNTDLQNVRRKAGEAVKKTKVENNADLTKLNSEHKLERDTMVSRHRSMLDSTRDEARTRLDELRKQNESHYEKELKENSSAINRMRDEFHETRIEGQREHERELTKARAGQTDEIRLNRERLERTNQKMITDYSRETQRIESEGEKDIQARQNKFSRLQSEQEAANDTELNELHKEYQTKEAKLKDEHLQHLRENAAKQKQAMANQEQNFQKSFKKNDELQKESLDLQKKTYLKELYKQGARFDSTMATDASRANDPFYRTKTFDAKLTEREDGYFVDGKVPDYDRENVDIKVQKDKIVIIARRSYEKTLDEENTRLQTTAYQTYRQEFKIDSPILADKAITRVEKDGSIHVFVPKKGFGTKRV